MGGWSGADNFSKKMGGKGQQVCCMYKMFGIDGCPHCKKAADLFEADKEKEGRKAYFKKNFYAYGKIEAADGCPEKVGSICLVHMPMKPVEHIMKKVQETDEDLRWPVPTDLENGGLLVLSKTKGDNDYPNYSVDYINTAKPIPAEAWKKVSKRLADVSDPLSLAKVVESIDDKLLFSPREHMKEGEKVRIRLLPIPGKEESVPFGLMFTHYVAAPTPWDRAWAEVGFDPERHAEVLGMLGEDDVPFEKDGGGAGGEDLGW